jgi:potassium-transporting ATPase KdpC subunit
VHRHLWVALRMMVLTIVLTGIIYPLFITGVAQLIFPHKANGSMVTVNGSVVGSNLIGQQFTQSKYFWPRPSAAGTGYDAMDSSGSNLGPTSKTLIDRIKKDVATLIKADPGLKYGSVPVDMVTASGSGLDPDITPANAYAQAARVAAARGLTVAAVRNLVKQHIASRQFGVLGEPHVNVLLLNVALDQLSKGR